jgi:hypothetical protein
MMVTLMDATNNHLNRATIRNIAAAIRPPGRALCRLSGRGCLGSESADL